MKYKNLLLGLIITALPGYSVGAEDIIGRTMAVHEFEDLGLVVWLETDPKWRYEIVHKKSKSILRIETPTNVYPPISMSVVSFKNMSVEPSEFDPLFDALLETALTQHNLNPENTGNIVKRDAQYGELKGTEVEFQTNIHGEISDAKVFLGLGHGNGPVLLQAYTLAGKMSHIDGQLRRSWGNIRYLD